MKLKSFLIFSIFIISVSFLSAQNYYYNLNYSTAVPLGETGDYISNFSWRGMNIEGQYFLTPNVSAGFNVGWNVFDEKLTGEFTDGTKTLYGTQVRYINSFPILAEGRYHIGEYGTSVTPYVGVGVGTIYNEKQTEMGIFVSTTEQWQFGLAPAAGVLIPVAPSSFIHVGVKYNYAFEAGDMMSNSFLAINVGFAWGN